VEASAGGLRLPDAREVALAWLPARSLRRLALVLVVASVFMAHVTAHRYSSPTMDEPGHMVVVNHHIMIFPAADTTIAASRATFPSDRFGS
jgi:hypothetical protein